YNYFGILPNEICQNGETTKSWYEMTKELGQKDSDTTSFEFEDKENQANTLQQKYLLMIICADEDIAVDAGREVINSMGVIEKRRRVLNLEDLNERAAGLQISSILD